MRIKDRNRTGDYIRITAIVLFLITGPAYWFGKYDHKFIQASLDYEARDSSWTVQVEDGLWAGSEPYYTCYGKQQFAEKLKVRGAHKISDTVQFQQLPYYPPPLQADFQGPSALVLNISHWSNPEEKPELSYHRTLLPDTLPLRVVSLSGPYQYFFGSRGLYSVNHKDDRDFSFPIHFELLDGKGNLQLALPVEAEVAGMSTKKLPMKSLNIRLRGKGVSSSVFFGEEQQYQLHSLRIRNAGNDFQLAFMRDVVVTELSRNTHNITLDFEPVAVFVNGEFWGLQYLREHISEKNLQKRFSHLKRDQILLGELRENEVKVISNGFDYKIGKLMAFIQEKDFSVPAHYEELGRRLNLDNFIDYIAVQTFVSNTDWPHNNVKGVFLNDQLHFILYDADFAFAWPQQYQQQAVNFFDFPERIYRADALTHNFVENIDHYVPTHVGVIYSRLMQADIFRQHFIRRYKELLSGDFSQQRIAQVVHEAQSRIAPLMPAHMARWGYPASMDAWHAHVQQIISFCQSRRNHVLAHLGEKSLLARK